MTRRPSSMIEPGNNNRPQGIGALAGIIGLVVVFAFLLSCFTVVNPGHRGVRVTLGKVAAEPLGEGLAFKWPLGMSKIEEIDVKQQQSEDVAACFSSDLQTVQVKFSVMYKLVPNHVVSLYQDFKGDPYATLIAPRIQESLKQVTAKYTAEAIVQKREEVREETRKRLTTAIGEKIQIVDLNIVNIDLTKELEQAIEAKMVQQQAALKKEFELNSERKEAEIVAVKAEAEAKATTIRGEALLNNPLVLQMEIIKKWNGISPTVVVVGGDAAGTNAGQIILPIVPSPGAPRTPAQTTAK